MAANVRGAVTATNFVTSIEYDARGQRQRIEYGNDTLTTYEHDPRTFRLRRLHTTNSAETLEHQDLRYTYDPVGNITEIRDLAQPVVFTSNAAVSADQRFTYDALYRLIQAEGPRARAPVPTATNTRRGSSSRTRSSIPASHGG